MVRTASAAIARHPPLPFEGRSMRSPFAASPSPEAIAFNEQVQAGRYALDHRRIEWRRSVDWVDGARIAPQTVRDTTSRLFPNPEAKELFNGAVYRENGEVVPSSLHLGSHQLLNVPSADLSELASFPFEGLPGCWLFGGVLKVDFGHFLTEGLGRLWALEALADKVEGVVFIVMNGVPSVVKEEVFSEATVRRVAAGTMKQWPFIGELLGILCPSLKVKLVGMPVRVESLIVPSQLMGLCGGDLIGGHEAYRTALRKRIAAALPPKDASAPRTRLYISRAGMDVKSGNFFMEDHLESLLAAQGYQIVRPERMGIAEQLSLYDTASHIIIGTGSAAHMLAMNVNEAQHVALLHRHPGAWGGFGRQLKLMGAGQVTEMDRIAGRFVPKDDEQVRALRLHPARMVYELDLPGLWADLQAQGFVSGGAEIAGDKVVAARRAEMLGMLCDAYRGAEFQYFPR